MYKETYIERIVVTFEQEGKIKGAHQELITTVYDDDGSVLSSNSSVESLDPKALSDLIPQSDLLRQIDDLRSQLASGES